MKIHVGKTEVDLDEANLNFNEANLNERLTQEAALYNYYGEQLARANLILSSLEDDYEHISAAKFAEYKAGNSDKLTEAMKNADDNVKDALKKVRQAKYIRDAIHSYMRSMDKAHENMINLAISIRGELKKLNPIFKYDNYDSINDIVKGR